MQTGTCALLSNQETAKLNFDTNYITTRDKPQSRIIKVRDKRPSNVSAFGRYLLEIPWANLFSIPPNDQKLCLMTYIINYGLNLIMPERSIKIHHNDRP